MNYSNEYFYQFISTFKFISPYRFRFLGNVQLCDELIGLAHLCFYIKLWDVPSFNGFKTDKITEIFTNF